MGSHNSCEIWDSFSRTPMRNFLWCYYGWLITSWAFEKYIYIKNAIFFNLFWYKVFVHWKLKLLNFLVDSVLIYFSPKRFVLAIDVPYLGACLKYIWKWGDMLVALTFYHSKKWIFLQESLIIYIYMYKNIGFPAQAEYSYFPVDFRLRISLKYSWIILNYKW